MDKTPSGGVVGNIKDRKLQSEGLIRINVGQIIEQTDLSCCKQNDIARQVYVRVVDLAFEDQKKDTELKKLPQTASPADLCNYYVMPGRH